MSDYQQLSLFPQPNNNDTPQLATENGDYYTGRDLGTFRDSMRAPIHRWFRYPAGYSYKFVFESFDLFDITPNDWVYDPFSGTGTTLLCAKQRGINAYGVEAHSFVHWVAQVKLFWEYDLDQLGWIIERILLKIKNAVSSQIDNVTTQDAFPELVHKCYHALDLKVLYILREFIKHEIDDIHIQDFLKLALTDTLRGAAAAGTGWPYISPRKNVGGPPKNALQVFENTVRSMVSDIIQVARPVIPASEILNVMSDSRTRQQLQDGQISLALTSPPYLNNYDYADRTRLETYFWGITESWRDITEQFRNKLIVAATTQISRGQHDVETSLSKEIAEISPPVFHTIQQAVLELTEIRLQKKGKKDYDLMVALYFNDMLKVLQETHRVLKKNGHFCLVIGDSAPYGIHVPTDRLIGELALGLGFQKVDYHELRRRGGKWKDNPQRHNVVLRESIVVLSK